MPDVPQQTFKKSERLCSKIEVDRLFNGKSHSMSAFPVRVVYRLDDASEENVAVLVSVSKKRFHRAVKRNRVKRQIRESYRKNKHMLWDALQGHSKALSLAFIWLENELCDSLFVEKKIKNLLQRVAEKIPVLLAEKEAENGKAD